MLNVSYYTRQGKRIEVQMGKFNSPETSLLMPLAFLYVILVCNSEKKLISFLYFIR